MRDLMVIMPTSAADWNLDFDFINGVPRMVTDIQNTQDQRAAISAYTLKGTIPGKKEEGIGWSQLYDKENTILNIDNEIKQKIQERASSPENSTQGYMPLYTPNEKGIEITILRT